MPLFVPPCNFRGPREWHLKEHAILVPWIYAFWSCGLSLDASDCFSSGHINDGIMIVFIRACPIAFSWAPVTLHRQHDNNLKYKKLSCKKSVSRVVMQSTYLLKRNFEIVEVSCACGERVFCEFSPKSWWKIKKQM